MVLLHHIPITVGLSSLLIADKDFAHSYATHERFWGHMRGWKDCKIILCIQVVISTSIQLEAAYTMMYILDYLDYKTYSQCNCLE
jgi:hypothetical protein